MTRLILTSSDSAGGCLLRAGVGDIVIPFGFRFVWGELPPDAKLEAMLGPGSLEHFPEERLGEFHSKGMGALDLCEHCEAIELWFDPMPNAQLMLVQLLDCLSSRRVFGYWEVGSLLDGLAYCPLPAVAGLDEGPFTEEMHDDDGRRARY